MGSFVVSNIMWYVALIGIMWYGSTLDGDLGVIIFWISFVISSFILFRLYGFTREFFITTFAKCHEIDQTYIDEEMRKYEEEIKKASQ